MLLQADAFRIPLPNKSVHCVVTSPPYWGLRKYQGDQGEEPLGLESTPERHIERMVDVFREVRRVLRDDGVVWLNYGDCYSAAGWESNRRSVVGQGSFEPDDRKSGKEPGNKAGSLMLMPHRLAIALQDDGWIIRNDVVWYKRNPMPESVAGWRYENGSLKKSSWRHTRAHEYVFQLVKKMGYYCNQEAVREKMVSSEDEYRKAADSVRANHEFGQVAGRPLGDKSFRNVLSGRNPRSVMDVPTAPYKGAHYATFPPNLIAPLIRASCPRRACPECGQAWAAVVEKSAQLEAHRKELGLGPKTVRGGGDGTTLHHDIAVNVKSYRPTCECGHDDYKPGKVLDIFGGSGTTGAVAKQLLRDWIVMDISRPYLDEQAKIRTKTSAPANSLEGLPLFNEIIREED